MKFLLNTLIMFTLILPGFCQKTSTTKPTKSETQQWIAEKIGLFSFKSNDGKVKNDYIITFEESYIWIKNINWEDLMGSTTFYTRIQVTDIVNITYQDYSENYWLIINLKEKNNGFTKSTATNEVYPLEGKYEILLNKSFKENDLPNRMKKAFSRLIEVYGGKPFNSKEAF